MTDEEIEMIRLHVGAKLAMSMMIASRLEKTLKVIQITPKNSCDLNPHLSLAYVAKQVASDVSANGFDCTDNDVLLLWLTYAMYNDKFLPSSE